MTTMYEEEEKKERRSTHFRKH